MGGFFISTELYEREVTAPDGSTGKVRLRRLNAGDQAAIQDTLRMAIGDEADAALKIGTMRMLTVSRALVDWDLPGPKPSPEAISQLEPDVFEQIYGFVEIGSPPTGTTSENGTAPEATEPSEEQTAKRPARPKPVAAS